MASQATIDASPPTLQRLSSYGEVGLSGLEIAAGLPLAAPEPTPLPRAEADPLAALEHVLVDALRRPPCLVSFSGGRDSSTLLAAAVRVAAREGLAPPVAITQRFPALDETAEADWQELVIGHLDVTDWVRIDQHDELDIVGPVARPVLLRHGPTYPMNAHFAIPLLEAARGGTVVTGLDGDTLFGSWRWRRVGDVLARRERPRPRDAITALHRLAPAPLQRAALRRLDPGTQLHWLAEPAQRLALEERTRGMRVQPARFDRYVEWFAGSRHVRLLQRQLDVFAAALGGRMVHPFLDHRFLAALARWGGPHGRGGRTDALLALFGDLLPEEVLTRRTKARFDRAYLASHTRELTDRWDGSGLDAELVNADALREELARPVPVAGVGQLVQWLWLREQGAVA